MAMWAIASGMVSAMGVAARAATLEPRMWHALFVLLVIVCGFVIVVLCGCVVHVMCHCWLCLVGTQCHPILPERAFNDTASLMSSSSSSQMSESLRLRVPLPLPLCCRVVLWLWMSLSSCRSRFESTSKSPPFEFCYALPPPPPTARFSVAVVRASTFLPCTDASRIT